MKHQFETHSHKRWQSQGKGFSECRWRTRLLRWKEKRQSQWYSLVFLRVTLTWTRVSTAAAYPRFTGWSVYRPSVQKDESIILVFMVSETFQSCWPLTSNCRYPHTALSLPIHHRCRTVLHLYVYHSLSNSFTSFFLSAFSLRALCFSVRWGWTKFCKFSGTYRSLTQGAESINHNTDAFTHIHTHPHSYTPTTCSHTGTWSHLYMQECTQTHTYAGIVTFIHTEKHMNGFWYWSCWSSQYLWEVMSWDWPKQHTHRQTHCMSELAHLAASGWGRDAEGACFHWLDLQQNAQVRKTKSHTFTTSTASNDRFRCNAALKSVSTCFQWITVTVTVSLW